MTVDEITSQLTVDKDDLLTCNLLSHAGVVGDTQAVQTYIHVGERTWVHTWYEAT